MTISGNPFTFGAMVRDPERFIGRRAELTQIVARLNGSQVQGSSVVGPRRIGKSSLLYYLARPRTDEPLRPDAGRSVIYFSAAEGGCEAPETFRSSLMLALLRSASLDRRTATGRRLADLLQTLESGVGCSWETAREALDNLPYHPVICLDEFESLLTEQFDDRFFTGLRNWANEGKVTWVTASARPLQELAKLHSLGSPFFNLLATIPLGDLMPSEADQLLMQADATAHPFLPEERRMLSDLAGCNPYHLQIVASALWDTKASGQTPNSTELRYFLCNQPNPPETCNRKRRTPAWVWLVGALAFIIVGLVFVLAWQAPAFTYRASVAIRTGFQTIWSWLGDLGDGWGGVVFVTVVVGAVILGIKRRSVRLFWHELRRKLFP